MFRKMFLFVQKQRRKTSPAKPSLSAPNVTLPYFGFLLEFADSFAVTMDQ